MNKLSKAIEWAVDECLQSGSGHLEVDENIEISAEWVTWYENRNFDVVAIYIYENKVIKFSYQIEETATNK